MKNFFLFLLLGGSILAAVSCKSTAEPSAETAVVRDTVLTDGLRFCESTYPYRGGLLVANFGTEELDPLNTRGKGYIAYYKDGNMETIIPTDGHLSAPKGMFEKDGYLFVCDVNKIVVYRLSDLSEAPKEVAFPFGDLFVNDLAAAGDTLFASVTNSGRIYRLDISDPSAIEKSSPVLWAEVPGANGLVVDGQTMYVASYPPDGNTTPDNVVYRISGLTSPVPEKFTATPGQYDGIALSADKKTLYVTSWQPSGVFAIDMDTRVVSPVDLGTEFGGAADMTLRQGMLYIPDLPASRVVVRTTE